MGCPSKGKHISKTRVLLEGWLPTLAGPLHEIGPQAFEEKVFRLLPADVTLLQKLGHVTPAWQASLRGELQQFFNAGHIVIHSRPLISQH